MTDTAKTEKQQCCAEKRSLAAFNVPEVHFNFIKHPFCVFRCDLSRMKAPIGLKAEKQGNNTG